MAFELSDINNFDLNTFLNFNVGPWAGTVWFIIKVFLGVVLVLLAGYLLWKFKYSYKVPVLVKRKVGHGGIRFFTDRAKVILDSSGTRILMLSKKYAGREVTCPLPAGEYRVICKGKDAYELWMDDNYQLHPCKTVIDDADPFVRVFPEDRRWWARKEDKRRAEKYNKKDFLEKYLPSIVIMAAFVISFLIAYFATSHVAGAMAGVSNAIAQLATALASLGASGGGG